MSKPPDHKPVIDATDQPGHEPEARVELTEEDFNRHLTEQVRETLRTLRPILASPLDQLLDRYLTLASPKLLRMGPSRLPVSPAGKNAPTRAYGRVLGHLLSQFLEAYWLSIRKFQVQEAYTQKLIELETLIEKRDLTVVEAKPTGFQFRVLAE